MNLFSSSSTGRFIAFLLLAFLLAPGVLPAQTPLACGEIVTNAVSIAGQRLAYRHSGAPGDLVSIRMLALTTGLDALVELRDGASNLIASALNRVDRTLTNGGDYLIIASDQGNNETGNFSLTLERLNGGCPATPALICGEVVTNSITVSGELAAYVFDVSNAPQTVTLRSESATTGFNPTLELFDPAGRLVVSAASMTLTLTNSGRHTVLVGYASGASRTGDFRLAFETVTTPCAAETLACGRTAVGTLDAAREIDAWTWAAGAGDAVTFRLLSTNTTLFAPRFELYDPQGRVLNGAGGTAFTGTLTNAGAYTLLVYYNSGSSRTGLYWLTGEKLNGGCQAQIVQCGDLRTDSIAALAEINAYTFAAVAGGDFVTVRLESATASFTPTMELFDPFGRALGNGTAVLSLNLTNVGVHTLLVSHSSGASRVGSYRLAVERVKNPCASTALVCGSVTAGQIVAEFAINTHTISSAGGQPVTLRMLSTNTSVFGPRFELYDPNGRILNGAGGTSFTGTLTNAGEHTLLVYQNSGTSPTGNYWIGYERLDQACDGRVIGCSDLVTNSLSGLQEIQSYALAVGLEGAFTTLRVESTTTGFVPTLELFDPSGRAVGSAAATITSNLTNAGNYTVLVSYASGASRFGGYRLAAARLTAPCQATALACGQIIASQIGRDGEIDSVSFVSSGNEPVTLRLLSTNTALFAPRFELYDPNGRALNGSGGIAFTGTLTNAGSHTLLVYQNTGSSQTGSYWLTAERTQSPCNVTGLDCNEVLTGSIGTLAEIDTFSWAVASAPVITRFRLENITASFAGAMELFDPNGRSVATSAGVLSTTLTNAGVHTLLVLHNGSSAARTGDYRIVVEPISPSCNTATTPLACGDRIDGAIAAAGEADFFSYPASAGELVTFRLLSTNTTVFSPRLELFDPAGRSVNVSGNTTFTGALTNSGAYVLAVSYNSGSARVGSYHLAAERLINPCNPLPLACGQIQTNSLVTGALDLYTFSVETNDVISLRLTTGTTGFTPGLELYDPAGRAITAAGNLTFTGTLTNVGTYTVLVRAASGTLRAGIYTLYRQSLRTPCGAQTLACGDLAEDWIDVGRIAAYSVLGSAGEVVTLRFTSTSSPAPSIEVYDPDGVSVTLSSLAVARLLTKTGRYLILVQPGGSVPTIQDYQLLWQNVRTPCAAVPLACGAVQAGRISVNGEVHAYTIATAPGERLFLKLFDNSQFFVGGFDLYDPAGTSLARSGTSWAWVATNGGTYTVLVHWDENANPRIGDYLLALDRVPNACLSQPLTVGTRTRGSFQNQAERHAYTFEGVPGPITLCISSERFASAELYSPSGTLLGSSSVQIQAVLPSAGTYTVFVRANTAPDNYTLFLRLGTVSCSTIDSRPPVVSVFSPEPGAMVRRGVNLTISWFVDDAASIVRQEIRLSTDGGATFPTQLAEPAPGVNVFDWTVPPGPSVSSWRFRVLATDSGGNVGFDDSDATVLFVHPAQLGSGAFYYDAADQLTGAGYDPNVFFSFAYDAAGNRTRIEVGEDPYQDSDGDGLPNGWEREFGLNPQDPADASSDLDGDGASNLDEYLVGTDPRSAGSVFRIVGIERVDGSTVSVTFLSVPGREYVLESTLELGLEDWFAVDFIQATGSVTTVQDFNAYGWEQAFYRIREGNGGIGEETAAAPARDPQPQP